MSAYPIGPVLAGTLVDDINVLDILRRLQPGRAVSWSEAHSVAERQAMLLLDLVHVDEPPVPQFVICNLPGIFVDWCEDWPISAMAIQAPSHWRIVVKADEPVWRQRFSLAHELKHVIDDPVIDRLWLHRPAAQRQERAERLCNWFAACLLMPRPWIKRDWCGGMQKICDLSRRYYVSEEAMSTRLSEIGLAPITLAVEPGPSRHRKAA